MEIGAVIGRGARAEVYALPDGRALKLYHAGADAAGVELEARIGQLVHAAGIPSPAIYGTVVENGRIGIVCERLDGPDLIGRLLSDPTSAVAIGRLMAELQIMVHARTVPGLPLVDLDAFARELQAVPLPSGLADPDGMRADAIACLANLPAGDRVCHLDFHPANIIATAHGPVIIDWPNARLGNPDADVARTVLILRLMPAHIPTTGAAREQAEAACATLLDAYLKRYRELRPISEASLHNYLLPLAVARYSEGLSQQHALLGALIAELRS